ncbi:MAG: hypothetical protein R2706_13685 [Acidimicrobiales bacterium]
MDDERARTVVTLGVAFVVLLQSDVPPSAEEIADPQTTIATQPPLRSHRSGDCARLRRGFMTTPVSRSFLRLCMNANSNANGRMWSVEAAANMFIGPPLGAALLTLGFATLLR